MGEGVKQKSAPSHSAPSPVLSEAAPLPTPGLHLRFPPQSQDLSQIMQKSDQVEPVCGKGTHELEAAGIEVGRAGSGLESEEPRGLLLLR